MFVVRIDSCVAVNVFFEYYKLGDLIKKIFSFELQLTDVKLTMTCLSEKRIKKLEVVKDFFAALLSRATRLISLLLFMKLDMSCLYNNDISVLLY